MSDVADQPGLRRSFFAIGLAVILGFLFRAAFNEEALSRQVRKAATNVHEKIVIDFDSADLSLADGPFPEFAIVVKNVRFQSDERCWLSPAATVDELRLPLNLAKLFTGVVEITEVKLGEVQLQLRTPSADCRESVASSGGRAKDPPTTEAPAERTGESPALEEEAPLFRAPVSRGPISRISVHSLQVQYLPVASTGFEIDRLDIERLSETPLKLRTVGELNLGGATLSGDYSSRARFQIDYDHPALTLKLSGTWREGTYTLNVDSDIEKRELDLGGRIDHLPLSQILPFLKKYEVLKGEYDGRQVWLNLQFRSPGRTKWLDGIPVEVERVSFEGDLGEIEGGGFHIRRWNPVEFSNTEITLRNLQIEKLLRLFGQTEIPKSLGALGELNGVLKLEGARRLSLSGEYSGLELIFSNRGERRVQVISLMTGTLNYDQGRWSLTIPSVRPYEGLFLGEFFVEGNEDSDRVRARLHIDEMHLGPEVQALMSGGGSLGRWAADIEGSWSKGVNETLRGQILAQDLSIDGVDVARVRSNVNRAKDGTLNVEIRAADLAMTPGAPARGLLRPLLPRALSADPTHQASLEDTWRSDQLHVVFDVKNDEALSWKLRPVVFKGWQMRSEGGWNTAGELRGTIYVREKERDKDSRWRVEGVREAPIFVEEK